MPALAPVDQERLPGLERSATPEPYSGCAPDSNSNRVFCCSDIENVTLQDKFGRQITDLRISVTDRCNFRCIYCRSADPENYQQHDKILSWPELERLGRVFRRMGIEKVRVTGGEPLLPPGVGDFIARLTERGFPDHSMTTTGDQLSRTC